MNITSTRKDGVTLSLQTPRCHVLSKAPQGPAAETALQQEEALIQAAQRGDAEAFDALVKTHGRALLAYLKRLTGSHDDAEDLVQETLFRAFSTLKGFHPRGRFRAWLFTIAYHKWVYAHRRKNTVRLAENDELDRWSRKNAKDDTVASREMARKVRETVALLPDDQRDVVLLRLTKGLSHKQIAEVVKAEPATVRWRFFRARQAMRKALSPWLHGSRRPAI